MDVETIDSAKMASDIRKLADEVEHGNYAAFALAICDEDGSANLACVVNQNMATPDLIDEMVGDIKRALFASLED